MQPVRGRGRLAHEIFLGSQAAVGEANLAVLRGASRQVLKAMLGRIPRQVRHDVVILYEALQRCLAAFVLGGLSGWSGMCGPSRRLLLCRALAVQHLEKASQVPLHWNPQQLCGQAVKAADKDSKDVLAATSEVRSRTCAWEALTKA